MVCSVTEMDAVATGSELNKSGSGGSERSEDSGGAGGGGIFEYIINTCILQSYCIYNTYI